MLSKNNKQEKNRRLEEKNNRFSIRKFTVGTASVLIGAFFMGVNGTQTVHAADTKSETTTVNVNTLEQTPENNVNNSLVANVNLGDDLGLGDLLNNYNKQFGDKNQTTANKADQQPATTTSSDNKPAQAQQTNINDDLSKLQSDADKVLGKKVESQVTVNVTLPNVEDPDDDYYWNRNVNVPDRESTAVESADGNYTWETTTHKAVGLNNVLANTEFTNNATGNAHDKIPNVPGYRAKLVEVEVEDTTIPNSLKGKVEESNWDQENALQDELTAKIEANPYELPEYTTTVPYDVKYYVEYEKVEDTPVNAETRERLDVTLPTSIDPDEDYYYGSINTDANNMTGTKSADGKYTWTPVTHSAISLDEALSGSNFVYAPDGTAHHTLPAMPGYRAKITDAEPDIAKNSSLEDNDEIEAEVEKLYSELQEKIKANPYEIPEYTTNLPLDVAFTIEYEKVSDNGDVITTPALPEYKGNVAGIPETRPADKPFEGGVAGNPLTEDTLPEARVGIAGAPLTQEALPEAQVGIAGAPLTQEALPEAQVGVAGEPLTEAALPEAQVGITGEPLTQEGLPEAQVGITGEPLTQEGLPEARVGIAGAPLTQEGLPEAEVGVVGEPLTEAALPEAQVGIAGEPLTEEALPEAQVGVAGEPLTQDALPEARVGITGAPLTQEALPAYTGEIYSSGDAAETPALPEYTGNTEELFAPVHKKTEDALEEVVPTTSTVNGPKANNKDTKVSAVASHTTDSNNDGISTRTNNIKNVNTEFRHAQVSKNNTYILNSLNNHTMVTGRPKVTAGQKQNSRQAVLPQTGAKANMAGMLGLMVASVGAILGLAVTKKHEN